MPFGLSPAAPGQRSAGGDVLQLSPAQLRGQALQRNEYMQAGGVLPTPMMPPGIQNQYANAWQNYQNTGQMTEGLPLWSQPTRIGPGNNYYTDTFTNGFNDHFTSGLPGIPWHGPGLGGGGMGGTSRGFGGFGMNRTPWELWPR